ncbi:MAG: DUF1549 domain-containing protein [Planctomycetaceae bacterium]
MRSLSPIRVIAGCLALVAALAGSTANTVLAQKTLPPPAERTVDFDADIRPLFEQHCESCHGAKKQLSGFRIDREGEALRGGDNGQAFTPGKSADSLLVKYIAGLDPDILMPPEGDLLSDTQVGLIRAWIDQGAKWGKDRPAAVQSGNNQRHWSLQPVLRPVPPMVRQTTWPKNLVDRFILQKLETEQVTPSPEADRATLLRRLSFDLIGLPPTPAELEQFLAETRPNAYELQVERLLASPHFGERWGRHWLDLARYADSDGYEKDSPRPYAWRWRQWVIEALNRDLPFDQFTIEQLAGDLLPNARPDQHLATGFHRNTLTNKEGGADPEEFRVAAVVDRVNTTGSVWMGLTVGCAQCHSHKYDPLTLREYYGLFAFFNQADEADLPVPLPTDEKAVVPALVQTSPVRGSHILLKGDFLRPGEPVPPHTPEVLPPLPKPANATPTRLELARWLVNPGHPLTARVTMNRVWQQLFGQGLVTTPDDFGTQGALPSHPQLLDWLAAEFMLPTLEMAPPAVPGQPPVYRGPWSLKRMLKIITCSATYRQQSNARPELSERDPRNVWLARQNRLRLEAEIVRDAALAASELLVRTVGGPSVRPPQPAGVSDLTYAGSARWTESTGPERYRRGLYTWFQRTSPYPMLMTFDAPESNVSCTRRERSNTPLQSLTLLNDPVFFECARKLGQTAWQSAGGSPDQFLTALTRRALARDPTPEERKTAEGVWLRFRDQLRKQPEQIPPLLGTPPTTDSKDVAPPPESLEEGVAVLMARLMLNLDEFITRE